MTKTSDKIYLESFSDFGKTSADTIKEVCEYSGNLRKKYLEKHGVLDIGHAVGISKLIKDMVFDLDAVVAGFFHDLYSIEKENPKIKNRFGPEVYALIEGYGKIDDLIHHTQVTGNEEEYIRMVLSLAEDIRVLLIFIANRYYKITHLDRLPDIDRKILAERTLNIYAPLIHRLGLGRYKAEMENIAFQLLYPDVHKELSAKLSEQKYQHDKLLDEVLTKLKIRLNKHDLDPDLQGRAKHLLSIYRKMERTSRPFEQIFDLLAVRAVVDTVPDCYKALAVAQQHYKPILEEFDDYIQRPKPNGYQSLHVLLENKSGMQFELQIRTKEMHRTAEFGVAAHWQYKEDKQENETDRYVKWLREHVNFNGEVNLHSQVTQFFKFGKANNDIFVLTPKGDLKRLPSGSTPIDFAFSVHREVGLRCSGARVNDQIVPFNTVLQNGDRVDIKTSNQPTVNSDWIKIAQSHRAKAQIRKWLREQLREHSVKLGEELISKGFKRYRQPLTNDLLKTLSEEHGFSGVEDFYASIGTGKISVQSIIQKLYGKDKTEKEAKDEIEAEKLPERSRPDSIIVGGMDNLLVNFGKCCMPIPGDPIVGYITRGKGVTIHRETCRNARQIRTEPERVIDVKWGDGARELFIAGIRLELLKTENFVKEVTPKLGSKKVQLMNYNMYKAGGRNFCTLVIQVANVVELGGFMNILNKMRMVKTVHRLQYSEYKLLLKKPSVQLGAV